MGKGRAAGLEGVCEVVKGEVRVGGEVGGVGGKEGAEGGFGGCGDGEGGEEVCGRGQGQGGGRASEGFDDGVGVRAAEAFVIR